MEEAARAGATAPHRGLPDEIFIWEILVRLPPKSLLRCRAVCRAWRSATSARDFLLAHHARQLTLPILYYYKLNDDEDDVECLDIIPFDHRAGLPAAEQIQSAARLGQASHLFLEASCDGLLVVSGGSAQFAICNPVTRQYAPLSLLSDKPFLAMYPYPPTGEYRLLTYPCRKSTLTSQVDCYVFALGSGQLPRNIGWVGVGELNFNATSLLFRGSLYWYLWQHESESNKIIVFDTTTESFRSLCGAAVPGCHELFEMDGMLGMSIFNMEGAVVDIWVLQQDYEREVWTFKCQIEMPVMEIRAQCGSHEDFWNVVVVPRDGELFVLLRFAGWLLQADMNGKLVASFHRKGVGPTRLQLKQTLVPHAFFPTLEGYVVNDFPFI
ncbi:hypothetical protein ACQJBY_029759 [Aegilops geniculata]